jgi:hypothetical protein
MIDGYGRMDKLKASAVGEFGWLLAALVLLDILTVALGRFGLFALGQRLVLAFVLLRAFPLDLLQRLGADFAEFVFESDEPLLEFLLLSGGWGTWVTIAE